MEELKGILKRQLEIAKVKRELAEKEGNVDRYNYYDHKAYVLAKVIDEISYKNITKK